MDISKSRLKTGSNGSLHSTYTSYGSHLPPSATVPRGQIPPRRRALRNVSQNSILPPSPGPLAGMLKTTTETGDIRIFSIPPSVTPASYHQFPRSRTDVLDGTTPPRYTPKKSDNFYCAEDHRPFRSYRDTTSEIISLYGYDNQAFYMTPGSPILDDNSHRSYSITTSSSRQLPSQKSSGTLQSHSSGGGLQRPRSPFPYPTRLKRPGARPASPALAENGCIDYTRMVELDRVSQRTVHGSYRSTYNSWSRRPPPLSLRPDFNRSVASLPSRASPGPYYHVPVSHRSRTPGSSQSGASRYGRFERYARMPVDRSARSPSLTSIVDMYQRPITSKGLRQPTQTAGSFYYDYSEDFDKPIVPHHETKGQLLMQPPPIQDDDGQIYREHTGTINSVGFVQESFGRNEIVHQTSHPLDCCGSPEEEPEPDPKLGEDTTRSTDADDTELSNLIAVSTSCHTASADAEGLKGESDLTPAEDHETSGIQPGVSKPDASQSSRVSGDKSESDRPSSLQRGNPRSDVVRCSLDPTLPDFASIFSSFDLLGKSPCFKPTDISARKLSDEHDDDSVASSTQNLGNLRHRRNVAAVRISTTDLHDESGHFHDSSTHEQDLDILSPEPISPARGLKVKNSIPQLMKALPPLPSKISREQHHDLQACQQQNSQSGDQHQDNCLELKITDHGSQEDATVEAVPTDLKQTQLSRQSSPSKFKVRVKPSCSQNMGSGNVDNTVQEGQHTSTAQAKPRLKIKLSRSQLGQGRRATGDPLTRVNRLKQCNSLADLALYANARTEESGPCETSDDGDKGDSQSERLVQSTSNVQNVQNGTGEASPQPSDPFSIPYPPSPEDHGSNKRSISSSNKDTLVPRPSCSSGMSPIQENGLRKKMSMFRLRIAESFTANPSKKCKKAQELERSDSHTSINMTLKGSATNLKSIDKCTPRSSNNIKSDWMTNRVKRWAIDARRALRSYVRRTLDRSSRWSE